MDLVVVSASFRAEDLKGLLQQTQMLFNEIILISMNWLEKTRFPNASLHKGCWKSSWAATPLRKSTWELRRNLWELFPENKWELQIFILIWYDQTSVDVLQVGTVFSPLRDSFPSLSCTGSDQSLPWCLICKLRDLEGFGRGKTMCSTWKGQCSAENGRTVFLHEDDLSAWDLWAVWIRSLSSRVWVISLEGCLIYGACPKSPWEENLL